MKWVCGALIALSLIPSEASALPSHRRAVPRSATRTIVVYTGVVDTRSAERFFNLIGRSQDRVIGLDITVDRTEAADGTYNASLSEGRLIISSGDPLNAPEELVVNGSVGTTWDMWRIDGFYLIKSGGMHAAGALSWGAEPVDEAAIRLNPNLHIIRRPF